jgi:hypothetical protein
VSAYAHKRAIRIIYTRDDPHILQIVVALRGVLHLGGRCREWIFLSKCRHAHRSLRGEL